MTNLPFVTIGIPVYNEEKFVAETILSAINQTYKNIKIVISDNCSTDRSYEIIQSHVLRLANVKIIKQGKNIGAVNNFAYVLEHSDTEYFCWLGGHDVMRPTFIEKTVDAFQINKGISLVYPKTELIDENSKVLNVPTDSDIDTTLLDNIKGPIKVVRNLQYCTAVHGVFKTTLLKSYTIKEIIGADHIILYHA
ncbi:MAG: glycosyltransferase family A protein, partial [Bacteroidetes bacterium]|nr:glycosyltransferase family A protein [Bacteroidota bacterium]